MELGDDGWEMLHAEPTRQERQPRVVPLLKGLGMMSELAGKEARQDFRRELPPVYALACLAALFRPLLPLGRGLAAMTTSMLGLTAVLGGSGWLLKR